MRDWINLFEAIEIDEADTTPIWQQIVKVLQSSPYADDITVFGSVARGEAKTFSDVDIYIHTEDAPWNILRLAQKFYGMLDPFYEEGDVLMVRSDDARSWKRAKNARALQRKIETEGVPLSQIDIVELSERYDPKRVSVLHNPSSEEFMKLAQNAEHKGVLRGLIDLAGDFYVWDAEKALHSDVDKQYGTHDYLSFIIFPNCIDRSGTSKVVLTQAIRANPTLKALQIDRMRFVC